jgi:hypothetical protein
MTLERSPKVRKWRITSDPEHPTYRPDDPTLTVHLSGAGSHYADGIELVIEYPDDPEDNGEIELSRTETEELYIALGEVLYP